MSEAVPTSTSVSSITNAAFHDPASPSPLTSLPSWVLDERDAARIAHRRRLLKERAVRIHQPRNTSIAVDVEGLRNQVDEKQRRGDAVRRQHEQHSELVARQDRQVALLQHQQHQEEAERNRQLAAFWKEEQRPERRREYDLNSHEHLTSALYQLTFDGEDVQRSQRERQQQSETDAWLKQQMQEKVNKLQHERQKQREDEAATYEIREKAKKMEEAKINLHQAENQAIQQYNIYLSREKQARTEAEQRKTKEEEEQEVRNAVWGALLTEDPGVSRSALGPHRIIPHRWKGMSEEEKQQIRHTRWKQQQETKVKASEEKRVEEEWKNLALRADRTAHLAAQRERIAARQREAELMKWNMDEARRRRGHDIQPQNFTDEFFSKFGVYPR